MGLPPNLAQNAATLTEQESKFRFRALAFLGTLLKPGTPDSLRALAAIMISLFVFISFELVVLVVQATLAHMEHEHMSFAFYQYSILGESTGGFSSGFLLVIRMSSFEAAKRMEEDFLAIQEMKQARRRGPADDHE